MAFPADWITPDWPAPPNVRAVCTTRSGGLSAAPYDSLNLGDHVGDLPDHVAANRRALTAAMGGAHPVFLQQVHGVQVVALGGNARNETAGDRIQADACTTTSRGIACTIMVADCLPILLASEDGNAVAAAHAGWRGLCGVQGVGVVETLCAHLGLPDAQAVPAADSWIAWLGPCIGPQAFEVGPEVKHAFESQDRAAASMFKPHREGKWLADLPGLARLRLASQGIRRIYGNDGGRDWCTVSTPSRFFSHRRDRVSGRFAASIWLA